MHDVDGFAEVFGGTLPALIWHDTMLTAHHDIAPTDFPAPLPLPGTEVAPAPPAPTRPSAPRPSAPQPSTKPDNHDKAQPPDKKKKKG